MASRRPKLFVSHDPTPSGGFQKLNSEDLKPITITTPTIMLSGGGDGLGRLGSPDVGDQRSDGLSATNHNDVERHKNPFLQFLSTSSSASFSSLSGSVAGGNGGGGSDGGGRAAFVVSECNHSLQA